MPENSHGYEASHIMKCSNIARKPRPVGANYLVIQNSRPPSVTDFTFLRMPYNCILQKVPTERVGPTSVMAAGIRNVGLIPGHRTMDL